MVSQVGKNRTNARAAGRGAGRLAGKVAIVLGASREGNMGQAIAKRFLSEGAQVVVAGRGLDGLQIFAQSTGATAHACDVRNKAEVQSLADAVLERFGALDVAVNAAAAPQWNAFEATTEAEIDEAVATIFKGGFFFMQAMVGAMKRNADRGGSIINISSAVADIMSENHAAYMGAKAGLNHMTRAVANEYGQHGIRANIIAPGLTVTPMLGDFLQPGILEAYAKEYPFGRLNTVEDIAHTAVFVASDECFMTGQTFHVSGGLTLRRNPTLAEVETSMAAAAQEAFHV